jgi:hypothetical protein
MMGEEAGQLGSTRSFETAEGALTYPELSERLAVSLAGILDRLLQRPPDQIDITPEWLGERHRELAGHLFPEWAGRFHTLDVKVGTLTAWKRAPDADGRRLYLSALRTGDAGDLAPLQHVRIRRPGEAM